MNKNDVNIMLKYYGLILDSYKPGNVRLYCLWKEDKKLSDFMAFNALCAWLNGYEAAINQEVGDNED